MKNTESLNAGTAAETCDMPAIELATTAPTVEVVDLAPRTLAAFKLDEYLSNSVPTPGGIVTVLESWVTERECWEGAELAASHQRLYAILAKCYGFYLTMKSEATAAGVRKQLVAGLDDFVKQRGLKTLTSTHDMNKVVKAVFGDDRRRVSAYAMALRVALVSGADVQATTGSVPADQLAAWIASKGGVEEVRLSSKTDGMTAKGRADAAAAAIDHVAPLVAFKPNVKTMPFSTNDADKKIVLIATYRPTGDLEVLAVVKHDSVINAALAAYYADHKEEISDKATEAQVRRSAVAQAIEA